MWHKDTDKKGIVCIIRKGPENLWLLGPFAIQIRYSRTAANCAIIKFCFFVADIHRIP